MREDSRRKEHELIRFKEEAGISRRGVWNRSGNSCTFRSVSYTHLDLKSLEAQGVEIMTCGTCLDYYGLKEKLAVGTVTNMYSIVETMANAGKIIRP